MKSTPFNQPGNFYRGNLHTHSDHSDGKHTTAEVVRRYKEAGYDFLSLTDHFMDVFDYPINDTREFCTEDFATITSAELHLDKTKSGVVHHILAVGVPEDFAKPGDGETIHQIVQRAADAGAFIGICHPSWHGLTTEEAHTFDMAHSVEIYNHGSHVENNRGYDVPFWDVMLNEGKRLSGYATDDAHAISHDAFGGWMHVKAESLDPDKILEAMKAGHYYSSQGPEIHNMEIDGDQLHISCSPVSNISIQGHGSLSNFKRGDGITEATFDISKYKDHYVRATVVDDNKDNAWTNPVWFN